jgi:4-amino-4-deoxy-L-arabinose transferase-like glycosyltransferase
MMRGDYISPTFNYEPRLNKPVLSYWIVAAFYKVLGVSVGVERLSIALGAMVMILTALLLARAAADTGPGDRVNRAEAALWAALGLAIAPRLLMFSRRIFIDIYISMFMALTLLFFALAERYPSRRRPFLLLMYAAVGLGVLTKGPVAAALPGLVFGLYLLLNGELKRVREMMIPAGTLVVAVLVLPWYAALYHRYGWTYISSFIRGENIARYTEGVGVQSSRGPWFYLPVVFTDSAPIALMLVGAGAMWWVDRRSRGGGHPESVRIQTLLWLWIITIVVFFSFSAAKQDLYIFPIVPAVAALAGVWIARATNGGSWRRSLRLTAGVTGLVLSVLGIATIYVFQTAGKVYALDGAPFIGYLGAIGGIIVLVFALLDRSTTSLVALAVTMITLNWAFVLRVLPSFERYKPVPALSAVIRQHASADDVIVHYNIALPSMVYYLGRHIDVLFEPEPFLETLRQPRRVFAVLSANDYARLERDIGVRTCVLDRRPTVNVKLKAVLARDPLPQVLLITNQCQ